MGDGIQKKYALILNGDTETRHLENVDTAIGALRSEGDFQISVASPKPPAKKVEHFGAPDEAGLNKLVQGMAPDDDDLLVVYVTGHGDIGVSGEGCVQLSQTCHPLPELKKQLDALPYGRRLMVMDNCFAGGSLRLFANPKTTVVTQGSPGEKVSCQTFSPFFWSQQVPDSDRDGIVTLQERYAYALKAGKTESHTQFFEAMRPAGFSGEPAKHAPFPATVKELDNDHALVKELAQLKPGQLALVTFSADWCGPCQAYKKTFEALAKEYGGNFLMIRAEGIQGSEEAWGKYGVSSFPTVAFLNSKGQVFRVPEADRDRPREALAKILGGVEDSRVKEHLQNLRSADLNVQGEAIRTLSLLGERSAEAIPVLMEILQSPSMLNGEAAKALARLGKDAAAQIPKLKELSTDSPWANSAAQALGEMAKLNPGLLPDLLKQLETGSTKQRAAAAVALGFSGKPGEAAKVIALVARLQADTSPEVRAAAADALGHLHPAASSVLPILLKSLEDKSIVVVRAATFSLGAFPEQAKQLVPILRRQMRHADTDVANIATGALGNMGDAALPALPEILEKLRIETKLEAQAKADDPLRLIQKALDFLVPGWSETAQAVWEGLISFVDFAGTSGPFSAAAQFSATEGALLRLADHSPQVVVSLGGLLQSSNTAPEWRASLFHIFTHVSPKTLAKSARYHPAVHRSLGQAISDKGLSAESRTGPVIAVGLLGTEGLTFAPDLQKFLGRNDQLGFWSMNSLVELGKVSVSVLFDVLENPRLSYEQKFFAADALRSKKGDPRVVRKMREYWNSENSESRKYVLAMLQGWGPAADSFQNEIVEGMGLADPELRGKSIAAAAELALASSSFHTKLMALREHSQPRLSSSARQAAKLTAEPDRLKWLVVTAPE